MFYALLCFHALRKIWSDNILVYIAKHHKTKQKDNLIGHYHITSHLISRHLTSHHLPSHHITSTRIACYCNAIKKHKSREEYGGACSCVFTQTHVTILLLQTMYSIIILNGVIFQCDMCAWTLVFNSERTTHTGHATYEHIICILAQ